jgi:hypothetical protein
MQAIQTISNIKLAVIIFALNIVDLVLTQTAINNGGHELNPIMRYLLEQSTPGAWAIKLVVVVIGLFVILRFSTLGPRLTKALLTGLVIFMVVNCLVSGITLLKI